MGEKSNLEKMEEEHPLADVDEQDFLASLHANNLIDGPGEKSTIFSKVKYNIIMAETLKAEQIGFKRKKSSKIARRYKRYRVLTVSRKSVM